MADGYILSRRKGKRANQSQSFGFSINTKDIELLEKSSFQEFFGINYKLTQRFPERQNNNWALKITGWTNVPRCLDICYSEATIFLKRKYDKYVEIQGSK